MHIPPRSARIALYSHPPTKEDPPTLRNAPSLQLGGGESGFSSEDEELSSDDEFSDIDEMLAVSAAPKPTLASRKRGMLCGCFYLRAEPRLTIDGAEPVSN